jgi:hypothetical protein
MQSKTREHLIALFKFASIIYRNTHYIAPDGDE